jgi:hypothetical protein
MECLEGLNFVDRLPIWHEECRPIIRRGENDV